MLKDITRLRSASGPVYIPAAPAAAIPAYTPKTPLPPAPAVAQGATGKGKRNASDQLAHKPPLPPPTAKELATFAADAARLQAAQQAAAPKPGSTATCNNCARTGRTPYHDHMTCVLATCTRCSRSGHRAGDCPYRAASCVGGGEHRGEF